MDWKRLQGDLTDFDAEDLLDGATEANSHISVLPELTPAGGSAPTFFSQGEKLVGSWPADSGVVLVRFNYVVLQRMGLPRSRFEALPPGLFVVGQSEVVGSSEGSWVGMNLSVHDYFACGHWVVSFGQSGGVFECLSSKWLSFAIHPAGADPLALLSRYTQSSDGG